MSKEDFSTPAEFHNRLSTYFNAAVALPLLPFIWLFLEIKNDEYEGLVRDPLLVQIIGYATTALAGVLVLLGYNRMKRITLNNEGTLLARLKVYLAAKKQLYAAVAIAAALMALGLWLSAAAVIIIGYVLLLFYLTFQMPTPKRYVKELALEGEEKDIVLNKKDQRLERDSH